jgi:hypothetical protein
VSALPSQIDPSHGHGGGGGRTLTKDLSFSRPAAVRQELPAPVDQLPAAGHQARQLLRRGGAVNHPAPPAARQQVLLRLLLLPLVVFLLPPSIITRHFYLPKTGAVNQSLFLASIAKQGGLFSFFLWGHIIQ